MFWTIRFCSLLTLTFLYFYSLLLYFYVLVSRALRLAPREDWTLINLSRAFRAQDAVESGVDSFLRCFFFCFSPKRQRLLVAGKAVFSASRLAGSDCHLKQIIVKNSLVLRAGF